jgi:hypothetical protein
VQLRYEFAIGDLIAARLEVIHSRLDGQRYAERISQTRDRLLVNLYAEGCLSRRKEEAREKIGSQIER